MSNPFTKFLRGRGAGRRLDAFIERWDIVETLVVTTFREEGDPGQDPRTWRETRAWLLREYPHFREALAPFWAGARVAGEPAREDPFLALLSAQELAAFAGNWEAMQTLPAAREALNRFLLSRKKIG